MLGKCFQHLFMKPSLQMYDDKELFLFVTSRKLCYASESSGHAVPGLQGLSPCVGVPWISFSSLILSWSGANFLWQGLAQSEDHPSEKDRQTKWLVKSRLCWNLDSENTPFSWKTWWVKFSHLFWHLRQTYVPSVIFNLRKASSGSSGRQPSSEGCQIEGMRIMIFFFFFYTKLRHLQYMSVYVLVGWAPIQLHVWTRLRVNRV